MGAWVGAPELLEVTTEQRLDGRYRSGSERYREELGTIQAEPNSGP